MNRSQEELLVRIAERKRIDFFGFETNLYLPYLNYENAKPFLNEGVTKEEWGQATEGAKDIKQEMVNYMPFAWDKAINNRFASK